MKYKSGIGALLCSLQGTRHPGKFCGAITYVGAGAHGSFTECQVVL